jgi:hypothetical protein
MRSGVLASCVIADRAPEDRLGRMSWRQRSQRLRCGRSPRQAAASASALVPQHGSRGCCMGRSGQEQAAVCTPSPWEASQARPLPSAVRGRGERAGDGRLRRPRAGSRGALGFGFPRSAL